MSARTGGPGRLCVSILLLLPLLVANSADISLSGDVSSVIHKRKAEADLPVVAPGFRVSVYARVSEPMKLSFAPNGILYAGRQPGNRIHRIAPGGQPVAEFGPPMVDPDAVLVDARGNISGQRQAVLVGGGGILAAIFPNQTSRVIFNAGFADVDDMQFDRRGRLIFSDDVPRVLASSGGTLLRFNANGNRTVTGFSFGPDHALYVSDYQANRILRIARPNVR